MCRPRHRPPDIVVDHEIHGCNSLLNLHGQTYLSAGNPKLRSLLSNREIGPGNGEPGHPSPAHGRSAETAPAHDIRWGREGSGRGRHLAVRPCSAYRRRRDPDRLIRLASADTPNPAFEVGRHPVSDWGRCSADQARRKTVVSANMNISPELKRTSISPFSKISQTANPSATSRAT